MAIKSIGSIDEAVEYLKECGYIPRITDLIEAAAEIIEDEEEAIYREFGRPKL